MNLLIMGPAGSGKGTISDKIIAKFNVEHLSTGNLLRDTIKNNGPYSKQIRDLMDNGLLVTDSIINGLVEEYMIKLDGKKGFILDGFPRTLPQAKEFDRILSSTNQTIDVIINLQIDFESLAERITGRRICGSCGSIYHILYSPSKEENKCDKCHEKLIQRSDDSEEQLKVRLKEHQTNTEPVLNYYRETRRVYDVDASKTPDEVFNCISELLESIK